MLSLFAALLLSSDAGMPVAQIPCETVAACWLAPDGAPIARPKKFTGKPLPKADCGKNLLWLRHHLTCTENVCTSTFVGDAC